MSLYSQIHLISWGIQGLYPGITVFNLLSMTHVCRNTWEHLIYKMRISSWLKVQETLKCKRRVGEVKKTQNWKVKAKEERNEEDMRQQMGKKVRTDNENNQSHEWLWNITTTMLLRLKFISWKCLLILCIMFTQKIKPLKTFSQVSIKPNNEKYYKGQWWMVCLRHWLGCCPVLIGSNQIMVCHSLFNCSSVDCCSLHGLLQLVHLIITHIDDIRFMACC